MGVGQAIGDRPINGKPLIG